MFSYVRTWCGFLCWHGAEAVVQNGCDPQLTTSLLLCVPAAAAGSNMRLRQICAVVWVSSCLSFCRSLRLIAISLPPSNCRCLLCVVLHVAAVRLLVLVSFRKQQLYCSTAVDSDNRKTYCSGTESVLAQRNTVTQEQIKKRSFFSGPSPTRFVDARGEPSTHTAFNGVVL